MGTLDWKGEKRLQDLEAWGVLRITPCWQGLLPGPGFSASALESSVWVSTVLLKPELLPLPTNGFGPPKKRANKKIFKLFLLMKNRVREFRAWKGYLQNEFAKELGVSRQTVIAIEQGKKDPNIRLALKIAKKLDSPVEKIFILK